VLRRRYRCAELIVYPVTVQGEKAAPSIVRMLKIANKRNECDVLMLMRGGGSLEDLWAFNEEPVARAIYASKLPIICGVGHEMTADVRAPTPSAAAELVSPDQNDLQHAVAATQRRMLRAMVEIRNDNLTWLQQLVRRLHNQHPQQRLLQRAQRCDELDLRLQRAMQLSASRANSTLGTLQLRLRNLSPQRELVRRTDKLNQLQNKLQQSLLTRINDTKVRLTSNIRALQTISPLNTLARGYAIVQQPSGEVVTSTDQVSLEQRKRS